MKRSQKECPGCNEICQAQVKVCPTCDYAFPAGYGRKTVDPDEIPIRERFTFEPEREEDGSLKIDQVLGHRPFDLSKQGKHVKFMHTPILCEVDDRYKYEYFIKWRGMSYARCQWLTADAIDHLGSKSKQSLNRYLKKNQSRVEKGAEEDVYFNPQYIEVEKVLDDKWVEEEVELQGEELTAYLAEEAQRLKDQAAEEEALKKEEEERLAQAEKRRLFEAQQKAKQEAELAVQRAYVEAYQKQQLQPNLQGLLNENGSGLGMPFQSSLNTAPVKVEPADLASQVSSELKLADIIGAAVLKTEPMQDDELDTSHGREQRKTKQEDEDEKDPGVWEPDPKWQPMRRCLKVLAKLQDDPSCHPFCTPVPLDDYPDYLDVVDRPMDISTVERKIREKAYRNPEQVAKDVRLIWSNCKIYNQHGSVIWHAADALGKQFERLLQAWVLAFESRKDLKWSHPLARPWEPSCRNCQNVQEEEKLLLCDHCDAMYHMFCLTPRLKKIPDGAWLCPLCVQSQYRLHSHAAEDAARARARNAERPVKKVKTHLYLVKWQGLSYRDCTWETQETINDDSKISQYHQLNDAPPEDPPLTKEEIERELSKVPYTSYKPASTHPDRVIDLEAQCYSQLRAAHFLKCDLLAPPALLKAVGPLTASLGWLWSFKKNDDLAKGSEMPTESVSCTPDDHAETNQCCEGDPARTAVAQILGDMVFHISRGTYPHFPQKMFRKVQVRLQVSIEKGSGGLCMNIAQAGTCIRVLGFRPDKDGSPGSAEMSGLIKAGDLLVVVNGYDLTKLPFQTGIDLLVNAEKTVNMVVLRERLEEETHYPRTSEYLWAQPPPSIGLSQHGQWRPRFPPPPKPQDLLNWALRAEGSEEDESCSEGEEEDAAAAVARSARYAALNPNLPPPPLRNRPPLRRAKPDLSLLKQMGRLQLAVEEAHTEHCQPSWDDWKSHLLDTEDYTFKAREARNVARPIEQLDLASGEALRTFESVGQAARMMRVQAPYILACIKGKMDSAAGYKWRYASSFSNFQDKKPTDFFSPENMLPTANDPTLNAELLDDDALDALPEENGDLDDSKELLPNASTAAMDEEGAAGSRNLPEWRKHLLKKGKTYLGGNQLRDYQTQGVNWLLRSWYQRRGCILADEMGLGKTIQVVAMLEHLFSVEGIKGPFLVVVPLSTIEHWRREVEGWTKMSLCVYHDIGGGRDCRDVIREYEWYFKDRSRRLLKFHILVTTYDDLIKDYEELAEAPWRVVVVDEAHRLRNQKSKLLECLQLIMPRGQVRHGYQQIITMTGTPLQNNITELWSLLNFIEPSKFPDLEKFEERFGDMQSEEQVRILQRRLEPFLLRRVKEDVADEIPPKKETVIDVELTTLQKQYYRAIFEKNHAFLFKGTKGALPKLMNIQMELRKCCNHPFLVPGVEEFEMDRLQAEDQAEWGTVTAAKFDRLESQRVERGLVMSSGKMVLVDKLLPKLKREGHKVLFFSQMVRVLDLLEEYCEFRGYNVERLDGRITGNERQRAIDRFNTNEDSFVFLLSTRAGGVGINLTAADTVIIFDSDWNPQNDIQAQARCHRIGQTKDVMVYRLITRRSFEAEMFERASKKLGLEQAVLGTGSFSGREDPGIGSAIGDAAEPEKTSSEDVESLLKLGAYYLLNDDDEDQKFCEDDIEKILTERTRVRIVENGRTANWLNKSRQAGGTKANISKARFAGSTSTKFEDVSVDDPEFWKKVMPDMISCDDMLKRLKTLDPENETEETMDLFFEDMKRLMKQIQKLEKRNHLPSTEREKINKILLQITVREDDFDKKIRVQATKWQYSLEGSRRGNRKPPPSRGSPLERHSEKTRHHGRAESSKSKRKRNRSFSPEEDGDYWSSPEAPAASATKTRKSKKRARAVSLAAAHGDWIEDDEDEFLEPDDIEFKKTRKKLRPKQLPNGQMVVGTVLKSNQGKKDFNCPVCTICEDGGLLLMCDGPCMRSFHTNCLGMPDMPEEDEEWSCPDCAAEKHLCLLCGVAGLDNFEILKCSSSKCGRFYHLACLQKDRRPVLKKEIKEPDGEIITTFKCPLHVCRLCLKGTGIRMHQGKLLNCLRCPTALHMNCIANSNIGIIPKGTSHMICNFHEEGNEQPFVLKEDVLPNGFDEGEEEEEKPDVQESRAPPALIMAQSKEKRSCRFCSGTSDVASKLEKEFIRPPFLGPPNKKFPDGEVIWVHSQCAMCSPEVFTDAQSPDIFFNILRAVRRGRHLKCTICQKRGATLGCFSDRCSNTYHVRCAASTSWHPEHSSSQGPFLCPDHRPPDWTAYTGTLDEFNEDDAYKIPKRGHKHKNGKSDENGSYCLCGHADTGQGDTYIGCDSCNGWFHPTCVGMTDQDVATTGLWTCPKCLKEPMPAKEKESVEAENKTGTATLQALEPGTVVKKKGRPAKSSKLPAAALFVKSGPSSAGKKRKRPAGASVHSQPTRILNYSDVQPLSAVFPSGKKRVYLRLNGFLIDFLAPSDAEGDSKEQIDSAMEDGEEDEAEEPTGEASQTNEDTELDPDENTLITSLPKSAKKSPIPPASNYHRMMLQAIDLMIKEDTSGWFLNISSDQEPGQVEDNEEEVIDLDSMKKKIEAGDYCDVSDIEGDFRKIFSDCMKGNKRGSPLHEEARRLFDLIPEVFAECGLQLSGRYGSRGRRKASVSP